MNVYEICWKPIWKVDCRSLIAVLATSFDRKEIADLSGRVPSRGQAMAWAHAHCHSENDFSGRIQNILHKRHGELMEQLAHVSSKDLFRFVSQVEIFKIGRVAALLWALSVDPREGMDCIRTVFLDRLETEALQRMIPATSWA